MQNIRSVLISFVAVVGFAFLPVIAMAQDATSACDFNGVVDWFTNQSAVIKIAGALFVVASIVFAFMKKSMPSWVKDVAVKLLGSGNTKP